ncbi:MAG: PIG-L family deacetylase [Alteraurantiacibacter sp.]
MKSQLLRLAERTVFSQREAIYSGPMPEIAFEDGIDHLVPLQRPHFELRDGKLYFLISTRPHVELDGAGSKLWNAIDGKTTVSQLEQQAAGSRDRLRDLWQREAIELVEAEFPEARKQALVVEPHMDDAVLSIGGLMWDRRRNTRFTVLTVQSVSNYTSYHKIDRQYFDVEEVSELRRQESELSLAHVGGSLMTMGELDAALRFEPGNWSVDWFKANKKSITAYINHSSPTGHVEQLAQTLADIFRQSDATELYFNIGIGRAADHEATRNACLLALQENPDLFAKFKVFLYQDVPYQVEFPDHAARLVETLNAAGCTLEAVTQDIESAMPHKLRMVSAFGSQFKANHMGPRVVATALQTAQGTSHDHAETYYRLNSLPANRLDEQLYSASDHIENLAKRLPKWLRAARKASLIQIISPVGIGHWERDMAVLLNAFPNADFRVYLPPAAIAETARLTSDRISVESVSGGGSAWGKLLIRQALGGRGPIVMTTSFKLAKLAPLAQTTLFFAKVLPVGSVDNLVSALSRMQSHRGKK